MLNKLLEVDESLAIILRAKAMLGNVNTMYIDYHKPFVSRIWFQLDDMRVYLHKIEPFLIHGDSDKLGEALYHPHKWDSAMKIIHGSYEMGIGHSTNNEIPVTDCKLILPAGTVYEMTEKDSWHYVNPIAEPCYTLMVSGRLNGREMPIEPKQSFRELRYEEIFDILTKFPQLSRSNISELAGKIVDKPNL